MFETIQLRKECSIAVAVITRPKALNALNRQVLSDLAALLDLVEKDEEIRALILTGDGRSFVAGADIAEQSELAMEEGRAWGQRGSALLRRLERLSIPTLAAINGFALGGGCELAMACDIRIASQQAKFGQPEVNLGIIPGFGGTQRLPRLVGKGMGKYMMMTAEMIDAETALRIGLVEKVVPAEELISACEAVANTIMGKAPIAVKAVKIAVNNGIMLDVKTGVALEGEACAAPFCSDDRVEGMRAFLEKRPANFENK